MSHLANHTPLADHPMAVPRPPYPELEHNKPALLIHHADQAASHTWAMANQLIGDGGAPAEASAEALYDVRQAIIRQTKGLQQALYLLEPTAGDRQAQEDIHAAGTFALCAGELLQDAQPHDPTRDPIDEVWDHLTASTVHRGSKAGGPGHGEEVMHTPGFWGVLLSAFGRPLRAACGASLVTDTPPPPGSGCRDCAQRLDDDGPSRGLMILLVLTCAVALQLSVDAYQDGHRLGFAVAGGAAAACLTGLGRGMYLLLNGARR
jgi:hypothetical protein